MRKALLLQVLVAVALTLVACRAAAAPKPEKAAAPASAPAPVLAVHKAGEQHPFQPKRLQVVVEVDMYDFYFATPQGGKNPTIRVPAGKTIGLHIHNEGGIVHELMIGRKVKMEEMEEGKPHGYVEMLTTTVPADVFFYYGQAKAEVGGALFEELEVEPGIKDVWLRLTIPVGMKGEWEIGCFVPGHYEAGMKTTLIVE